MCDPQGSPPNRREAAGQPRFSERARLRVGRMWHSRPARLAGTAPRQWRQARSERDHRDHAEATFRFAQGGVQCSERQGSSSLLLRPSVSHLREQEASADCENPRGGQSGFFVAAEPTIMGALLGASPRENQPQLTTLTEPKAWRPRPLRPTDHHSVHFPFSRATGDLISLRVPQGRDGVHPTKEIGRSDRALTRAPPIREPRKGSTDKPISYL